MWYNSTTLLHCFCFAFLKFLETGLIYLDMLNVYKAYSEFISTAIQRSGPQIAQHSNIRAMRQVKVEILTLISTFVNSGVSKKKKKKGNVWNISKKFWKKCSCYNSVVPHLQQLVLIIIVKIEKLKCSRLCSLY